MISGDIMNRSRIEALANALRTSLSRDVRDQAAFFGIQPGAIREPDGDYPDSIVIGGRVFDATVKRQRAQLVKRVREHGYEATMDEVAYTWANRFIALRFMEAHGMLAAPVFSSTRGSLPDLLSSVPHLETVDQEAVRSFRRSEDDEGLYRYLVLAYCNHLHDTMPFLFEAIADYTELLFPARLLHTASVRAVLVEEVPPEDWKEVEILGWLYQYYISERKDRVYKEKGPFRKEDIPAVTQLFTPKWIVRYLVENSVGRLWLETHPDAELRSAWTYYIDQDPVAETLPVTSPEEITVLDPCMGSGHILVYAFELLYRIYLSRGYAPADIPRRILERNLYGLEIDTRATQLAGLALMMKAREYDPKIFERGVQLNIATVEESTGAFPLEKARYPALERLWSTYPGAKNYGSLIVPEGIDLDAADKELEQLKTGDNLRYHQHGAALRALLEQTRLLAQTYHCVVTNPPYMGSGNMNAELKAFVKAKYPEGKSDLMTCFMIRAGYFCKSKGFISMINIPSWMFLSSYEALRKSMIDTQTIVSLLHLGRGVFGSDFGTVAFTLFNEHKNDYPGYYRKLFDKPGSVDRNSVKREKFLDDTYNVYRFNQDNFSKIPGSPIAYWVSEKLIKLFDYSPNSSGFALEGIHTKNNEYYLRLWHEISIKKMGINKWVPLDKGGCERKWYGNNEYVINWENGGYELKNKVHNKKKACVTNEKYYFRKYLTWTYVTNSSFSMRYSDGNHIFDGKGPAFITYNDTELCINIAMYNTIVGTTLLKIINPTINYTVGDIYNIPYIVPQREIIDNIKLLSKQSISISKQEWNSRETSWDFTTNELLKHKKSLLIRDAVAAYCEHWAAQFTTLHANEEELNRIFLKIYDLEDELSPEVALEDVTILREEAPERRDGPHFREEVLVKQFLSYAVGCFFGRYSPHTDGLVLANAGDGVEAYKEQVGRVPAYLVRDNVLPLTDEPYFAQDVLTLLKAFLADTFGEGSVSENIDYLAGVLSPRSRASSESVIRDYFIKDFYRDHKRMYQNRPIYWLCTTGKDGAFAALFYLHRYEPALLARVRHDYVLRLQERHQALHASLEGDDLPTQRRRDDLQRRIQALQAYDVTLKDLADRYIPLDLDDGVKVNIATFEGIVELP